MKRKRFAFIALASMFAIFPRALVAQDQSDPAQMALKYTQAQEANAKSMAQYMWQQRTEVNHDSATVMIKLVEIRYADGKRQVTPISEQSSGKKKHGVRGRVRDKKIGEIKEKAQNLAKLLGQYVMMNAGQTVNFFQKGTISDKGQSGILQVMGSDVIQQGDSVTLWFDGSTYAPNKMTIKTMAGEDAVEWDVVYQSLQNGPFYVSQSTVTIASKELQVTIENFDYTKPD